MPEPTPQPSRKITLEELLRLKRHERPGPEYWARFDRELNAKVWQALVNPPKPIPVGLSVRLFRGLRWLSAGVASALALFLMWHGERVTPLASSVVISTPSLPVATMAMVTPAAVPAAPVRVASASPQPEEIEPTGKATYAVSNLTPTISPAGYNKIPATLSFTATQLAGERYAANNLNTAAFSSRLVGSAY